MSLGTADRPARDRRAHPAGARRWACRSSQVFEAIPLFVPNMLPYTIPATTLFASCVVYGRLSHDNEVVAIKAAGVHLINILKPAILLGMITDAVTAALYHTVIPLSQQMLYSAACSTTRRSCCTTCFAATGACGTRTCPMSSTSRTCRAGG